MVVVLSENRKRNGDRTEVFEVKLAFLATALAKVAALLVVRIPDLTVAVADVLTRPANLCGFALRFDAPPESRLVGLVVGPAGVEFHSWIDSVSPDNASRGAHVVVM